MNAKDAIAARRTAHLYQPESIDDSLIKEALELALTAPNHKLTFPWKFLQVGPNTREKLRALRLQIMTEKKGAPKTPEEAKARETKTQLKILNPAALVAFCLKRCEDPFQQREDYASLACGIQNFTIALRQDGWDSKWSTGGLSQDPRLYEVLKVDAKEYDIIGLVYVGHSAVDLPAQQRPTLDESLIILD